MQLLFGPENPALEGLRKARHGFEIERIRIIVAWARVTGVGLLFDALEGKEDKIEVVVGMSGGATSAEALAHLRSRCSKLFVFHKHHRQTFHPKIYCVDSGGKCPTTATLVVGSSNMTGGGLYSNIEGNILLDLKPRMNEEHKGLFESVAQVFGDLSRSPYCERITTDARINELLQDRYLGTEASLRRTAGEESEASAKLGRRRAKPEAPPPTIPRIKLPALETTFTAPVSRAKRVAKATAPAASVVDDLVADGRFFVRTLTENDISKLHGAVGTFEPDLSVTARDAQSAFWGWPDEFELVERKEGKPRQEWPAHARVVTSATGPVGRRIEFMQWFRPGRPAVKAASGAVVSHAHAAEHRFRMGPISEVREVVPADFDANGIVAIARCNPDEGDDFVVRFIATGDADYTDYARYLTNKRPKHSYGYGLSEEMD